MPSPTLFLPRQAADAPVIKFPDGVDLNEDDWVMVIQQNATWLRINLWNSDFCFFPLAQGIVFSDLYPISSQSYHFPLPSNLPKHPFLSLFAFPVTFSSSHWLQSNQTLHFYCICPIFLPYLFTVPVPSILPYIPTSVYIMLITILNIWLPLASNTLSGIWFSSIQFNLKNAHNII